MASAVGSRFVPHESRDPLSTTTFGEGEQIEATLDLGTEQILVGCGDSGTHDGGVGMLQALGIIFLDAANKELS